MRFYTTADISKNLSLTPEGFLLCRNVPIARTGDQVYHGSEVPVTPGTDGLVVVTRDTHEVFAPSTLASFEGKPITVQHPDGEVNPANWRDLAVGHVQNVRRGDGLDSDVMLGDFIIMDKDAIKMVQDRELREVSCGYDAEYEEVVPGRGKQKDIRGNHVALVEKGRCGALCAIHDAGHELKIHSLHDADLECSCGKWHLVRTGSMTREEAKEEFKKHLKSVKDSAPCDICGASPAFRYEPAQATLCMKCTEAFEEQKKNVNKDSTKGGTIMKKIRDWWKNLTADEKAFAKVLAAKDESPEDEEEKKEKALDARILAAVGKALDARGIRAKDAEHGPDCDCKDCKDKRTKDEEEKKNKEDKEFMSKDAATVLQGVLYRASIIAPDLRLPMTTDAVAGMKRKSFDEACCLHKRKALDAAFSTEEGKAAIRPFLDGKESVDFFTADCAVCDAAFIGASEVMKHRAASRIRTQNRDGGIPARVVAMNKANQEFWSRKGGV